MKALELIWRRDKNYKPIERVATEVDVPEDYWERIGIVFKRCNGCGLPVIDNIQPQERYMGINCSPECKRIAHNKARRKTYAKRKSAPNSQACLVCGETFTPKRSDAKFCSATCRQRAHRLK